MVEVVHVGGDARVEGGDALGRDDQGRAHGASEPDHDVDVDVAVNGLGAFPRGLADLLPGPEALYRPSTNEVNSWPPGRAVEAQAAVNNVLQGDAHAGAGRVPRPRSFARPACR